MIFGYKYNRLLETYENMDANGYTRSYREPYKLAYEWLKSLSKSKNGNVKRIEKQIKAAADQIEQLKIRKEELEQQMKDHCNHPISKLVHGGFAVSDGCRFHEIAECKDCGETWNRKTISIPKNFYI